MQLIDIIAKVLSFSLVMGLGWYKAKDFFEFKKKRSKYSFKKHKNKGFKLLFSENSKWKSTRTISQECQFWQKLFVSPKKTPEWQYQLLALFTRILDSPLMFEISLQYFATNKNFSMQN